MRQTIAKITQLTFSCITYLTFKIFFGFEVKGKENLKEFRNKPVIFAGNHTSRKFDGFISGAAIALPSKDFKFGELSPIRYLVYKDFFKWFKFESPLPFPVSLFTAMWLRLNYCIPVKNRKKEEYSSLPLEELLSSAISTLKNGEKLFIFPEGGVGNGRELRKGKRGVACLHKETGVPIVPMAIKGVYNPFTIKNLLRPRKKKKVVITFGKPIYNLWDENDSRKDLREGADRVMLEIAKLI